MNLRYLSMTQLSEVTGVDRRTIKARLAELEPQKKNGSAIIYDARDAIPMILFPEKEQPNQLSKRLLEEQLRYEELRADKVDIEVKQLRKELVPIEDVTRTVGKEYTYVRSAILTLPSKLAKPISMEDDPGVCQEMLKKEVDEILNHLQADQNLEIVPDESEESYFPEDEKEST